MTTIKQIIRDTIKEMSWRIRAFRGTRAADLNLSGSVLIIAPHPDDEAIGCGGLIARLVAEGNAPHVAILTGGGGSLRGHGDFPETDVIAARRKLSLNAARELGMPEDNILFLDFVDGSISARPEGELERLRNLIAELKPANILVPHSGEGWPDHLAARKIGLELAPADTNVYEYCVWMWYYNVWNLNWKNASVLKMTPAEHTLKLRAMDAYIKPLAPCGRPWSGVLPSIFIKANRKNKELYFKAND